MKKPTFRFKAGMIIKQHWNIWDDMPRYALVLETSVKESAFIFHKKWYKLRPLVGESLLDRERDSMYVERSYSEAR